jgi:hypothetical protein
MKDRLRKFVVRYPLSPPLPPKGGPNPSFVNRRTPFRGQGVLRTLAFACALQLMAYGVTAQELNARVTISYDQVRINQQAGNATQIYNDMQTAMTDFLNGRRWTTDDFQPEERLNFTLALVIQKATAQGDYEAQAQIQVTRPVYGTTYESVLLRYVDRGFQFSFLPDRPLNFNDNTFTDNLTSMMAFYVYTALALDYDSFSKRGGDLYIQRAYNVANLANSTGFSGWDARGDSRGRYWLIENLQNQQFLPFRDGLYTYHRLVLDTFAERPDEGRKLVLGVLNDFKQVNQLKPAAILMNSFFDSKAEELVQLFSNAPADQKRQAFTLLSGLDPTKTEVYRRLTR